VERSRPLVASPCHDKLDFMGFKALFFDVGNTLLFPAPARMLRALHRQNIFPSAELLRHIERRTKREFDALENGDRTVDHGFWQIYYCHLLDDLGLTDPAICADLVACTRVSGNWQDIRPHTREALLRLGQNYRLGVISNADGKIAMVLDRCGIADCFETITDSGIVGKEKPAPAIFEAALRSLGVTAEESLHIGDVYSVDYVGATACGMHAVLFDRTGAYAATNLPRVESLEELEAKLNSEFPA
jgi:putative hydrolase of the HAD superfamily